MAITEYVPYGDLLGYLRKSRGLNDTYYNDPDFEPQSSLRPKQLFRFALDIADGMNFLSSKKVHCVLQNRRVVRVHQFKKIRKERKLTQNQARVLVKCTNFRMKLEK